MTLSIEMPPAREARLRERAAQQGKDLTNYLLDLADPEGAEKMAQTPVVPIPLRPVAEYASEAEFVAEAVRAAVAHGHDPVTVAAIAQGIVDCEAGRDQSFEEYVAERQAEREARRTQRQTA